jgi:hypothetical protein
MKSQQKLARPIVLSLCTPDIQYADFAFSLGILYGYCIGKGMNAVIDQVKTTLICYGRNMQVHRALAINASHILFLDADMQFPKTTLERLMNRNKDIVGCTYSQRRSPRWYTHRTLDNLRSIPMDGRELFKVASLGMGCVLIKADVFKKIARPWFEVEYSGQLDQNGMDEHTSEDVTFYDRARLQGFDIWCDWELSQQIKHIGTFAYGLEHVEMMPTYLGE